MENNSSEIKLNGFLIIHNGDPKNCKRCQNSNRPLCVECGHTLSARIDTFNKIKTTTCEYCGLIQKIKFP